MRVIAIGDIHGRTCWKEILDKEEFDKAVFIGDYFDTHEGITAEQQISNFQEIIKARVDDDRINLLFGNHDLHYITDQRYSGYQPTHDIEIMHLLKANMQYLKAVAEIDGVLFSHAGVTKTWCKDAEIDTDNLVDAINELFHNNPGRFGFVMAKGGRFTNPYGDDPEQGPMWVRPYSLSLDKIDITQVVGHTSVDQVSYDPKVDIHMIDALPNEYLTILDGEDFNAEKV